MNRSEIAAATATASELLALSGEYGLPHMRGIALTCLGWNMGQTKDIGEGLRYLEQGLAAWIQLGLRPHLPFSICLLAETHLKAQRYAEGIEQVNLAVSASSEIGDQWFLPRIHMLRAQLLQQQACPDVDAAEASLRMAIDVAQAQCAKGWELRATMSPYSRKSQSSGKCRRASLYEMRRADHREGAKFRDPWGAEEARSHWWNFPERSVVRRAES